MALAFSTPPPYPPTEIWRLIFRFATASETSYNVDYMPFQQTQELQETSESLQGESRRLQTCTSLVRVSRGFRALAVEFLYEDVRIFDAPGLQSFIAGLSRSAQEEGPFALGKYVRRLELPRRRNSFTMPDSQTQMLPFPTHPIRSAPDAIRLVDLLHLCPNLEILVRPCLRLDAQSITFWASLIGQAFEGNLPRLMRLEWHESELDTRFYGTGHTDRLREIVLRAPNLRYLFLSSDRQNSLADLTLPASLHTLRLNRSHFHSNNARRTMAKAQHFCHVPNFRNLVLHTTLPPALLDFLAIAGQQLRTLELAFAPQMIFSSSQMQRLLSRCPRLEELVYYVGAPEISPLATFQCPTIRRVRLKVNPDEWSPCKPVLRSQIDVLEGNSFPELEEVILHDPTRWFMRRDSGKDLVRRMLRRRCKVRYEDGTTVTFPT
ncbi:hypothetical protein C8R43DRAFT_1147621 [Mycena crocata]|nr:hypothetical protein C8R43DRAFT_1147621 [Mycena crocata]